MTPEYVYHSEEILIKKIGGFSSKVLIVSFDSYTDNKNLNRPGFGEDFFLKNKIDSIYVISKSNKWYQYPEMDEVLKKISDISSDYERVFTYGSSMGGYAAIRHGAQFNATAIAIAPQYSIDPKVMPEEKRWHEAFNLSFSQERRQTIRPPFETIIFYDPFHLMDRQHVTRINQDIPVIKVGVPYAGHVTGVYLAEAKILSLAIMQILNNEFNADDFMREARKRRRETGKYYEVLSTLAQKKHPDWSIKFARKAAENCPYDAGHAHNLAQILKEYGTLFEAICWQRKAVDLDPDNQLYKKCLAMLLLTDGKSIDCRSILENLINDAPDEADLFHLMALSLAAEERFVEAVSFEKEAIIRDPKRRVYRDDLSHFQKKLKNKDYNNIDDIFSSRKKTASRKSFFRDLWRRLSAREAID